MDNSPLRDVLIQYNRIFKDTDKTYHDFARGYGMSDCAFWILYLLRESGDDYTQSEICGMISLPKQTVNSAIKNLQAIGYISLRPAENNRKNKTLALTDQGKAFAQNSVDKVLESEISIFEKFTDTERRTFLQLSEKYARLLREEYEKNFIKQKDTGKEKR